MMPQTNPTIMAWGITFESLGLLLNLGMVVSGIGLLMSRGWGRKLALWVAGLKIGRLVLGQGIYMIVCIPIYSRQMAAMMEQMSQMGPAGQGPPPGAFASFGPMMGIIMAVQCVAMIVLGSIYPAIVLWLLNTSAVKAWFRLQEAPR